MEEIFQMKKTLTTVMFRGTKAQEEQLDAVIAAHKGIPGALMPVLQQAQEIYGYLPIEVQRMIALKMNVSIEEVYGVSTFYSQFVLNPKGEIAIAVCLGTACYVKGSGDILDKITQILGLPAISMQIVDTISPSGIQSMLFVSKVATRLVPLSPALSDDVIVRPPPVISAAILSNGSPIPTLRVFRVV